MHGINRSRHLHLIESLLLLEELLHEEKELLISDAAGNNMENKAVAENYQNTSQAAAAYRAELEEIYSLYHMELASLAETIERYDKLFNHVKIEYVSKKLKDLKRRNDLEGVRVERLKDNIHTAYGISN